MLESCGIWIAKGLGRFNKSFSVLARDVAECMCTVAGKGDDEVEKVQIFENGDMVC